jgi:hypothetical protein
MRLYISESGNRRQIHIEDYQRQSKMKDTGKGKIISLYRADA